MIKFPMKNFKTSGLKNYIVEICASSVQSAINAEKAGANRIELCDNLYEGGTTPSYGSLILIRELLKIDINVLIRPRGGDFLYNDFEIEIMKKDIQLAKEIGVNGIVAGILTINGEVDKKKMVEMVELAFPMPVTFHRAFDYTQDPSRALHDIIEIGCSRILTSGQKNQAIEGKELIRDLIEESDNNIIIMPGSGINFNNIEELATFTNAEEFHFSAKSILKSKMEYQSKNIGLNSKTGISDYDMEVSDIHEIQKIIQKLNQI